MSEQTMLEQVRWQDLKVRSEVDIVIEIAQEKGWEDCEVFGYGAMITEPQESKGWKLIPANLYKDSIPPQAVERLHQIINAGIRVRGVIIADDKRSTDSASALEIIPAPAPARPRVSLSFVKPVVSWIGKTLLGLVHAVGTGVSLLGKVLLGLVRVMGILILCAGAIAVSAGIITLVPLIAHALTHLWPLIPIGLFIFAVNAPRPSAGTATAPHTRFRFDPKLVILVDDGTGGTTWVSLFTWYD